MTLRNELSVETTEPLTTSLDDLVFGGPMLSSFDSPAAPFATPDEDIPALEPLDSSETFPTDTTDLTSDLASPELEAPKLALPPTPSLPHAEKKKGKKNKPPETKLKNGKKQKITNAPSLRKNNTQLKKEIKLLQRQVAHLKEAISYRDRAIKSKNIDLEAKNNVITQLNNQLQFFYYHYYPCGQEQSQEQQSNSQFQTSTHTTGSTSNYPYPQYQSSTASMLSHFSHGQPYLTENNNASSSSSSSYVSSNSVMHSIPVLSHPPLFSPISSENPPIATNDQSTSTSLTRSSIG